jgi:hypothetical protein
VPTSKRQDKACTFLICFVQKCSMAKLDNDDPEAIKDLIEVTVEEVIDRNGLVTQGYILNLF